MVISCVRLWRWNRGKKHWTRSKNRSTNSATVWWEGKDSGPILDVHVSKPWPNVEPDRSARLGEVDEKGSSGRVSHGSSDGPGAAKSAEDKSKRESWAMKYEGETSEAPRVDSGSVMVPWSCCSHAMAEEMEEGLGPYVHVTLRFRHDEQAGLSL